MEVTNNYIVIKSHIDGSPKVSNIETKSETLAPSVDPGCNEIIVKNLYVSIDPYQISRRESKSSSQKASSFVVAVVAGQVIDGYGVGKVLASANPEFEKGDLCFKGKIISIIALLVGFDTYFM
nr:2-alkenal reductase (NADP(+)-dependent)-like [Ziziphus jujuba var. spinosa]